MSLSVEDRARIASRFEVWKSIQAVQTWWHNEKGIHTPLSRNTIYKWHSRLITTGSVCDAPRRRVSPSRSEENICVVKDMFAKSPDKSIRQAVRESGLTYHSVQSILKIELDFRPWKPHYCQALSDEDCDRRLEYGEMMTEWLIRCPELCKKIVWTDEAIFHVGGFVNRHNCHYWAAEDPRIIAEKVHSRPKLTVWCGMTSSKVVGPVILRDTMNAERYLNMLRDQVYPILSSWDNIDDLIFMQDGAAPHFALAVRDWLDSTFPGRWLGRRGPHEWPARSPDLTPCDFFLWGWAKEEVYKTNPKSLEELKDKILEVLGNVPSDFLSKTIDNIPKRLKKLAENKGAHVEF